MTTSNMNLSLTISAVDQASQVISQVGNAIQQIASGNVIGAVTSVGSAIVGIGAQATDMAAQYQQSMLMVQSLTGSTSAQMAQYDSQLKQLAVDAGTAPQALSQGLYGVISSGYSGADAMKVLTLATEDSKIGMTDASTTTAALTSLLNNFGLNASDATRVNGEMLATVTAGNSSFGQYASAITKAATTSRQFKISMEEMNAAWSTLTANRISAAQATTDFDQSASVMRANIGTVTKSLHDNGIAFDEAKFNTLSYGGQVKMLSTALDQANAKHIKVTGVTQQAAAAISTIAKNTSMYNTNLATNSNRLAMLQKTQQEWSTTQQGFNQKLSQAKAAFDVLMITLGNKLLPILGQIVGAITPLITAFSNWVAGGGRVNGVIQQIGGILQSLFLPIWQQLVTLFQTQLVPLWFQLQTAIAPIMPQLRQAAMIIGGVLYASFVTGIAVIRGFIGMLSGLLTGVVLVVQGIVTAWQGGVQFLSGIISFFVDLFTGKWNNLGTDLSNIWAGIVKMFQGSWQAIEGIFVGAINGLIGLINGFLQGVVSGINTVLAAAHQATISVGTIPMLSAPGVAAGNFTAFTPTASKAQGVTPAQQAYSNAGVNAILAQLASLGKQQAGQSLIQQANTATTNNALNNLNNTTVPAAANTAAAATKAGHAKTAAQVAKAADTANAQRMRLATAQQKALKDSSSSAVQALVNQSKAAAAKGDTATAAVYAQQADTLASQQHAAATKAANAAKTAAHHAAVLAAAAARKAQATKNHADIMKAKEAAAKAKVAAQAAKAAVAATRHKKLIDTIVNAANQVSGNTTNTNAVIAATAAGVILPDYAAGTAYTAYNAQPQPATNSNVAVTVNVASGSNDPKKHGQAVADEVKKQLAKHLRQSAIAPRYTHGGPHK